MWVELHLKNASISYSKDWIIENRVYEVLVDWRTAVAECVAVSEESDP